MEYTTSLLRWIHRLEHYEIPSWEELPCLDLYMDQVITLMEQYLSVYQKEDEKLITPSMINNYVKLGVIPKPYKKRYNRIHLAYLTMVCSLKQVLSISVIQKILPVTLTEPEAESAYCAFRTAQKQMFLQATAEVAESEKRLQEKENATFADLFEHSVQVALKGNIYKILSEIIAEQGNH